MQSHLPIALGASLCIGSALFIYIARLLELRTPRHTIPGVVREKTTLRLFVGIGTLAMVCSFIEFAWRGFVLDLRLLALGWACALLSIWLRRGAIAALGKFWSLHVEIRSSHQLVSDGPFRWVRHPTYLSMLLEIVAVCSTLMAPVSAAISLLLLVPALMLRIHMEEGALVQQLGTAYVDYRLRTPSLFPYKLPSRT